MVIRGQKGSGAKLFSTLVALYIIFAMPLNISCSDFKLMKNDIPNERVKPKPETALQKDQPIEPQSTFDFVMTSVIPIGITLIELRYFLTAIRSNELYSSNFDFLHFPYNALCISAAIILCYLHLLPEDQYYWFRTFITSCFATLYLYLHVVIKFSDSPTRLQFGYQGIGIWSLALVLGILGFLSYYMLMLQIKFGLF